MGPPTDTLSIPVDTGSIPAVDPSDDVDWRDLV
jgi:hypothetical protein